jgi:hypothetical protein
MCARSQVNGLDCPLIRPTSAVMVQCTLPAGAGSEQPIVLVAASFFSPLTKLLSYAKPAILFLNASSTCRQPTGSPRALSDCPRLGCVRVCVHACVCSASMRIHALYVIQQCHLDDRRHILWSVRSTGFCRHQQVFYLARFYDAANPAPMPVAPGQRPSRASAGAIVFVLPCSQIACCFRYFKRTESFLSMLQPSAMFNARSVPCSGFTLLCVC